MNRKRLAVGAASAAVALGLLWWFWPRAPKVEGPRRYALARPPTQPAVSTFALPIRVPYADLEDLVEKQVPEQILSEQGQDLDGGWSLDLLVQRPGDVWARGDGDRLVIEVPLKVEAKVFRSRRAERRADRGKDGPEGVTVAFEAALELAMALAIDEAWALRSTTELGLRWVDPPTASIGGLQIPIRKPVEKAVMDQLAEVAAEVDARLAEQDAVRQGVTRAWTELASVRQLSTDPPVWLVGTPEALYLGPLTIGDDALQITAGYRGRFATVLGDPGPRPPPPPLPPRQDPPADAGFDVTVPIALRWEALSEAVAREVTGSFWSSKQVPDGAIEAKAVTLYPSGEHVVVQVDWSATHPNGSAEGTAWLSGVPVLDPTARAVRIDAFDYRLDTSSSAVWSANALAESSLEAMIRERLVFPYGERLDAALAEVNAGLAAGRPDGRGGSLHGAIASIEPLAVTITDEALLVEIRTTGQAAFTAVPRPPPPGDEARPAFHR